MKKRLTLFLAAVFLLAMTACSSGNELLENASPESSALALYVYDGETTTCSYLFDTQAEKELLKALTAVKAKPAPNWQPEQAAVPIYALEIGGTDGRSICAAWTDGHWISADGTAYVFDFDFSSLSETYAFTSSNSRTGCTHLPCLRHLTQDENGWHTGLLTPAEALTPPEGITMTLTEQSPGRLQADFANGSDAEWCYGKYFSLQVLLGDIWYEVPPVPGNWAFADIAMLLPAGKTAAESYALDMYGSLPAGQYRLVVEGLQGEFSVD